MTHVNLLSFCSLSFIRIGYVELRSTAEVEKAVLLTGVSLEGFHITVQRVGLDGLAIPTTALTTSATASAVASATSSALQSILFVVVNSLALSHFSSFFTLPFSPHWHIPPPLGNQRSHSSQLKGLLHVLLSEISLL